MQKLKLIKNFIFLTAFLHSSYIAAYKELIIGNRTNRDLGIKYNTLEGWVDFRLKPNFDFPTEGIIGPIVIDRYPIFGAGAPVQWRTILPEEYQHLSAFYITPISPYQLGCSRVDPNDDNESYAQN